MLIYAPTRERRVEAFQEYRSRLRDFRRSLVLAHNGMLRTRKAVCGEDFKVLPYLVDEETLGRSRKQPKFVRGLRFQRDAGEVLDFVESERKDEADRRICRGQLVGQHVQEHLAESQR